MPKPSLYNNSSDNIKLIEWVVIPFRRKKERNMKYRKKEIATYSFFLFFLEYKKRKKN